MSDLIHLSEAWKADPSEIGNKAAALAELQRLGYPVPRGFCITTVAHARWREPETNPEAMWDAVLTAFRELTPPVAVRSSSPSEDRADASFAGQYLTVLGVRTEAELITGVEDCWRSAGSGAVRAYRAARGDAAEAAMAVLVQELVPATVSGVLFTLHPVTEQVDRIAVNANYGLGESVVSGREEPDTFILDKRTGAVLETVRGAKRRLTHARRGGGVEDVPVAEARRAELCLGADALRRLAATAREVERHYDHPMDLEWAFAGDRLFLLQARPVTTGAEAYYTDLLDAWVRERHLQDDFATLWVRGTHLSSVAVTPLYYSEMAPFFTDVFAAMARLRGAAPGVTRDFRYYRGFTYSRADAASALDHVGAVVPAGFLTPVWRANLRLALRHPRSLAFWCNIDHYLKRWHREWLPGLAAERPDLDSATTERIRAFIEYVEVQRRERSVLVACAVGYAADLLGLLAHLLERWAPGSGADTLGLLTSGLPDSLTHDENLALWELARGAGAEVRATLVAGDFDRIEALPGGPSFLAAVDAFRTRNPHRGCSDRDLYQPRWGDSRVLLLRQLAMMLRLGEEADPRLAHARATARREQAERAVLRGAPGAVRRWVLRRVLRATQRYWIHRDNQRHSFDHYFYELRRAYLALGERLVAAGALSRAEDVFFAGKNELYAWLDGTLATPLLQGRSAWRREWWYRVSQEEAPARLRGNQPHDPEVVVAAQGDLIGAGGAPGRVTGVVRVVRSLAELEAVEDGEILVTRAIDPAWTPVFGLLGGVVSEEGGILSHATVLGREYGLPVAIAAAGACTRLRTGQRVALDGTTGVIRLLPDDEP